MVPGNSHSGHRGIAAHSRMGAVVLGSLTVAGLMLWASPSWGKGPVLAAIKEILDQGLYRKTFTLTEPADVEIEAIASGSIEEGLLFSYAWLLDLKSRRVAWEMEIDQAESARHDNVSVREELTLPAGDYALYFSAHGGNFPIKKKITLLKLFELGTIDIKGGVPTEWDSHGRASEWRVSVTALDRDYPADAVISPARHPELDSLVAFRKARAGEFFRTGLLVKRPVRLRILALGEYAAREQCFADGAWIEDLDSCDRAWEMTLTNTRSAGGAEKNRLFDSTVSLAPGHYLICYATDDSHSYGEWNMQPPFDPESWGMTIFPIDGEGRDAVEVLADPPAETPIVKIDRVENAQFHRVGFNLRTNAQICIRGFGEWNRSDGRFLDYGWIEDALTLEKIWTMEFDHGYYAAGEARNRMVTDHIALSSGSYYLCYVSDYAHAYGSWSNHPPFDPSAWGIALRAIGADFDRENVQLFEETGGPAALVRIAPVQNSIHRRVRFAVKDPTKVKIIALGEGSRGDMYDYGWLEREDDRGTTTVWRMEYNDTHHAGGGKKNRRTEKVMTLNPGRYVLHYTTDDSHAFEEWNTDPPADTYLWGVTLLELP